MYVQYVCMYVCMHVSPNVCHENAICTDTDISYNCVCLSGYSGDGKNRTRLRSVCAFQALQSQWKYFFIMYFFHYNFQVLHCFRYWRMFQCICKSMSLKCKLYQYERFILLHVSPWIWRRWKELYRWGIFYSLHNLSVDFIISQYLWTGT